VHGGGPVQKLEDVVGAVAEQKDDATTGEGGAFRVVNCTGFVKGRTDGGWGGGRGWNVRIRFDGAVNGVEGVN
jgi:hypothetical protein